MSQNLVSGNIIRIIVIVIVLTAVRGERGSSGGADAIPRQRFGLRREQVHRKLFIKTIKYLSLICGNVIRVIVIIVHSEGAGGGDGDGGAALVAGLRGQGG